MKNFFTSALITLILNTSFAQIGIGIEKPDDSSVLDIVSESKGVLIPRLTSNQRDAIKEPADGLLVYNTDDSHFYYFSSILNRWEKIHTETDYEGGNPEIKAKNIILMIGNGMSYHQMYAANKNKLETKGLPLTLTTFPYTGIVTTFSADTFTTESSSSSTAISSGVKTKTGYVGLDLMGKPVTSIMTEAKKRGLSTGSVVTVSVIDAVPASFFAHFNNSNNKYENAAQFLDSDMDVCIGGGGKYFPAELRNQLKNKGYDITTGLTSTLNSTSNKLLGFISEEDILPRIAERGNSLTQSTKKALEILNKNEKGFFLMVGGSQIYLGGYARNGPWMMEELIDFDEAVKIAKDFAEKDGNTLVVVTGDYETGGLVVYGEAALAHHYTGTLDGVSGGNSAIPVPSFSFGPGAKEFTGFFDNTDFKAKFMKLYNFRN